MDITFQPIRNGDTPQIKLLRHIWSVFGSANKNNISIIYNEHRKHFLKNERLMMERFRTIIVSVSHLRDGGGLDGPKYMFRSQDRNSFSVESYLNSIQGLSCKTELKSLVMMQLLFDYYVWPPKVLCSEEHLQRLHQTATQTESLSFDVSTCKIWYAIGLLTKHDYHSALVIVNQVLSNIPPYALHDANDLDRVPTEADELYVDMFLDSEHSTIQRSRQAWMCDLVVHKSRYEAMPLAIQIELYFCDALVFNYTILSPFTCLYYLMFLCYHELHQYERRNHALRQLVDLVVSNKQRRRGTDFLHSINIAGHCLLIAGETDQAKDMFVRSNLNAQYNNPPFVKFNSAPWYMKHFC